MEWKTQVNSHLSVYQPVPDIAPIKLKQISLFELLEVSYFILSLKFYIYIIILLSI